MFLFIVPVMILQYINTVMIDDWDLRAILSLSLLGVSLVLDIRGLIAIQDVLEQEVQNARLEVKIRQHQVERQRILASNIGDNSILEEMKAYSALNEHGDPIEDTWRTTKFSTQRTYEQTVRTSFGACGLLALVLIISFAVSSEQACPDGMFEPFIELADMENVGNPFLFLERHVCDVCLVDDCADCGGSEGRICSECTLGYYLLERVRNEDSVCAFCPQTEDGSCLGCADEETCTECAKGYVLRSQEFQVRGDMGWERRTRQVCFDCEEDAACDRCSDNVCKTCMPGYFVS